MKHSAAELVKAKRVALMVSAENYQSSVFDSNTYHTFRLDNIDSWVDVVLSCEGDTIEEVEHGYIFY